MGVLNKLKDWLTGKSSKRSKKDKDKIREANRINMGGGVSTKSTQSEIKSSIKKAETKKKEEQKQAQAQTSSAFKATPPSAKATATKSKQTSQKKPAPFGADKAFKANSLPKTNSQKLKEQLDKDRAKKLSTPTTASTEKPKPPTIKHRSTALGTLSEKDAKSRLAKMNVEKAQQKERSRAADKLKPIIDAKYGGNTKEVKRRIKSGDYAADPDVAKYETLKHPNMASFGRGALSGTTFGLSELAIAKLPQSEERKEAERLYQANKNKGMESLGELAGSLASFGGTSAATDRLGGKLISKVAPNAAERLAEKQFIKNSAERLVKRGVETNVIGGASEELIKQVGKDKATKIVGALGNDIVQNLTTGAIYDVNKASAQYDVGSKEWWKELGKSALFNAAVTGGIAGGSMLTGGKQLVKDAAEELGSRGVKGFVKNAPDAKISLNRRRRTDVVLPNERPASATNDFDIDDALIESATTTEDFMNFFGLDRATAEILAKDKAKGAAREVAEREASFNPFFDDFDVARDAAGERISRGNIKPLAENLRINKELPRSKNREWRAMPRSAKRVDTSIEGMTNQLDELKGRTWKTDRERRAIETKINDVEDRLNRAKWRREGGADMEAMQKAYRGEYAGFDMGKSTNSYQSDVLEGKIKGKTATVVEMSPDEYIERTYRQIFKKPTEKGEAFSRIGETQKNVEKYAEAMRNGEKFPLPYLDYSTAQQEGRHRAFAAKAAGIDRIPVVIIDDEANPRAIINEVSEATAKAKNWMDSLADSETYDDFVKQNAKNADLKAHMKETGKTPKEVWQDARIERGKQNLHRISDEEADRILYEKIPENEVQGWFNDANSGYKPRILERMAESPDTVNASLNVAYKNYLDSNPKNALSFDEWLDTPQTLYRGVRGQSKTADDIFSAFTPYKEEVANKFAGKSGSIEEISITPRETYGSIMHNLESEVLVPESAIKESAISAPKSEGLEQYVERTAKQERMMQEGGEKADAIRAELGVESPEPVKERVTKPEDVTKEYSVQLTRENGKHQKVKVEATSEKEALDKAIGRKKGVKNAKMLGSTEVEPKAELPNTQAANQETKNINLDDVVNKERVKKTFREQFHELSSSVKTKISDSLNAFEEANKQYIKTDHQKWAENVGAIDKTRRSGAIASRSIGEGQVNWNGDKIDGTFKAIINGEEKELQNGKSLKQIFDGMDEATEKEFNKYLLLKHAPDRIDAGKPIFAGSQYNSREACEKAAKEILNKHPEFEERAAEIYQYTRNELQNRVDAGLIKQETVNEWHEKYPNYVPTGRDGDFSGEHDIWDLTAQLKDKGNTVGAGDIKKSVGGDQPIRSIKEQLADATNRNWRDMTLNNLFRKMFSKEAADELATYADGGLEKVLDNTINLSQSKGGKYFAEVYENGEMKRVEIEKSFYDAIEDLYKNGRFGNGWDVAFDAGSKVAYPFKQLVTSWNPIFMIKNGMRDFPEAIINSRQTKEFLECMPAAMKELKSDGEFYQAFRNSGVSQANFVNLEEALTSGDNWLKRGVNKFATAQEMVETYPRLIEYMATIKKAGYDLKNGIKDVPMEIRDIAAANAADVTVNFGRSGSVGKAINRGLVPFFNPSVQGWSKFLRNFSEQGSTKAMLGFGVKALALGAGVQAVNNFLLEDNKNYQQISARDKATNIIIPWTWGKDITADNTNVFIKIPKSRFASAFSLPMVNAGNENKMGWAEMIKVAGDQVAPVDPVESNLLSPLLLAQRNKTWYGTPIVPQAIENKTNPSQEYDANTSWFGRQLGKATEKLPTELQISPKKADYIIDAETGVAGDFILPMTTPSKQGGGNWAERHIKHPIGNVLKKAWTIDSTTQNNLSTRFYDKLQVATDNKDKEESKRLTGYSKEIGKINTAIRTLQNGNRKTKQEDIYGLQKVRNQMMQDALDGKGVPSEYKAMDAVQKYVGTAYAVNHFGTSADKRAMKLYGEKKYGNLSDAERRKAINKDKDFYKGVQSIGKLQGKMQKAGIDSDTTLSRAIALASVDASDDLFGAYKAQDQSRTETAHEMKRARTYFKSGGSTGEFVKLEKARKTLGKLPEEQRKDELAKLDEEFSKGKMSYAEYGKREKDINYNADISYLGLATSFALANSPERGYRVYDIKDANVRKGINLAAMGFTSRDVHKMKNDLDTDGNGYPKKQEIIDYINKGNFKDKATLFDALYSYKGKYNPFGAVTNYTRAQAAAEGKKKKVEWITDETDGINVKEEASSSGGRYYRRWGRWHRWGRSGGSKASTATSSAFNAKKSSVTSSGSKVSVPKTGSNVSVRKTAGISSGSSGSSDRRASTATSTTTTPKTSLPNVRRSASRVNTSSKMSITPLNVKTVKPKRASGGGNSNLSAALKDIENTQKKVAPPKARRK